MKTPLNAQKANPCYNKKDDKDDLMWLEIETDLRWVVVGVEGENRDSLALVNTKFNSKSPAGCLQENRHQYDDIPATRLPVFVTEFSILLASQSQGEFSQPTNTRA